MRSDQPHLFGPKVKVVSTGQLFETTLEDLKTGVQFVFSELTFHISPEGASITLVVPQRGPTLPEMDVEADVAKIKTELTWLNPDIHKPEPGVDVLIGTREEVLVGDLAEIMRRCMHDEGPVYWAELPRMRPLERDNG